MILYRIARSRAAGSSTSQDGWNIMTLLLPTPTRRTFLTSVVAFGASASVSVSGIRTARAAPGFAIAFDGDALTGYLSAFAFWLLETFPVLSTIG